MYSSGASARDKPQKPRFEPDAYAYPSRTENLPAYAPQGEGTDRTLTPLREFFSKIETDDILILTLFVLLFNENKQDDFLILLILAVLFFS